MVKYDYLLSLRNRMYALYISISCPWFIFSLVLDHLAEEIYKRGTTHQKAFQAEYCNFLDNSIVKGGGI
jgi:hypothetical protein